MENRNYKILKWSVIILVILNIALMVSMWMRPGPRGGMPPQHMEDGPKEMIIRELKFNDAQIKKYSELVEEHRSGMHDLEMKGREMRENYYKLMAGDTLDRKAKEEYETAIAENQKGIESITFDHFRQVRVLCNGEQKREFDKIIGDILKHMRGPHGPPPPPNGPPPPPEP